MKQPEKILPFKPVFKEEPSKETPLPSSNPSYSQADLDAMYEKGLKEGEERAHLKEETLINQKLCELLKSLHEALPLLEKKAEAYQHQLNQQSLGIFMEIFKKMLPHFLEKANHAAAIEILLKQSLSYLNQVPQMVVKVSPKDSPLLKEKLTSFLTQEQASEARVEEDPEFLPGSCSIIWDTGMIKRCPTLLMEKIEEYFNDFLITLASREEDPLTPAQINLT